LAGRKYTRRIGANCADFQINPALLAATAIDASRNDSNYFNVSRGGNRARIFPALPLYRAIISSARGDVNFLVRFAD